MGFMFAGCPDVASFDLSEFDTTNVTDTSSMFSGCYGLTSLDLSRFDTTNVTDMNDMFEDCSALTNLDLSTFNTTNVTNMNGMFANCSKLVTIYASDKWNTDKVDNSIYMFSSCTNLRGDISFNTFYVDKTYAKTSGGYLTYKAASTKTLSLNIDHTSGAVTSYDVSTSPMSTYKEMIRAVAAA